MKNYICINGKKTELTEEQMRQLGIEPEKKSPFNERSKGEKYHYIDGFGIVEWDTEQGTRYDDYRYAVANYCTDKSMMEQRAWHETLSRLLWRYSMEHGGDKIEWDHYYSIVLNRDTEEVCVSLNLGGGEDIGTVRFKEEEIADQAIKEIVEPFMEANPEFVW